MGNTAGKVQPNIAIPILFKIERLIAGNCDFLSQSKENNIRVGLISPEKGSSNPLSHQAIKIGDSDVFRLRSFEEGINTLSYHFEKDVHLILMRRRDSILFNLKTPTLDVTHEIDPIITKMYKSIDMTTDELDKIGTLFVMR